ncbi:MAG TPA: glycosyl hydrolase [Fimbriimonadaceae bacterium]|nr:glycosyl hydrolase [Fimbriimonadaceae bacterium]
MRWSRVALAFVFAASFAFAPGQDSLLAGFKTPPQSAKPQTWWHWINGNISKAGITADLEAMKKIGLGGAEIFNVDVGIPAGKTSFMSPQWNDAIAHAISEGRRLGLEICVHNCAGWSSSGGPWIKPEDAMEVLTWSETPAHGPSHFDDNLKQPLTRVNFYHDIAVYAVRKPKNDLFRIQNIQIKGAFERGDRILPELTPNAADAAIAGDDVRVLQAGPDGHLVWDVPDGDWTIIRMGYTLTGEPNHPAPESGFGLEVDKLSRKALDTHWAGMVASVLKDAGHASNPGLDDILIDSYEVGSQNWTPEFREEFKKRRGYDPVPYLPVMTGRVIDSVGVSERFLWDFRRTVSDLFADNYYGYFGKLCHEHGLKFSDEGYGNGSFDNLEVTGLADIPMGEFWVGGGAVETTKMAASAGHIYGKPIIGAESFTADTSHGRWLADAYSMKALGDRIFCLGINRYIFHRFAHQPWLNVVPGMTMGPWGTHLDRTMTWWEQGAAWMQYIARCQFLLQSGRFVADVAAYTGEEGPNDSYMLQGSVVPNGYDYDGIDIGSLMKAKVDHGDIVLPSGMRYRVLLLPDSTWMTWRAAQKVAELVYDGATILGPKPLHTPSLSDTGGNAPAPGEDEGVSPALTGLADLVWGTDGATKHGYGKGRSFQKVKLDKVLADIGCSPDVKAPGLNWIHRKDGNADIYFVANPKYAPGDFEPSFRVAGKEPELWDPMTGQTHSVDVWSSANGRTTVPLHLESAGSIFVVFRKKANPNHFVLLAHNAKAVKPAPPKIEIVSAHYDADDGAGGADVTAKVRQMIEQGETEIPATNGAFGDPAYNHVKHLHLIYRINGKPFDRTLAENDSIDLVGPTSDSTRPDYTVEDGRLYAWSPGVYSARTANGRVIRYQAPPTRSIAVKGPWKLTFPPNLGAPASAIFPTLSSWSDNANPGIKYFSGSATYHTTFDVPAAMRSSRYRIFLDLGRVKNFAEVWLNGKKLPTLWKAPFRLAAEGLRPGHNELVVRVTNLWPNRLIGDEQYPVEGEWKNDGSIAKMPEWALDMKPRPKSERITFSTWRFFKKDSPLLESGLLGPVSVVSVPVISLKK